MAGKLVLLDTSILIDYYRKTDKSNAAWLLLIHQGNDFAVSVITKYEIYSGANPKQQSFWDSVFENIVVIPFDEDCVNTSVAVNATLKSKRKQIALADLFIASTALAHNLPIATLNRKHFERIAELTIVD